MGEEYSPQRKGERKKEFHYMRAYDFEGIRPDLGGKAFPYFQSLQFCL